MKIDRHTLHRHFDVSGGGGEPVQYSVDLGPLRAVVLDTTIPGEDPGALDGGRLEWLDSELAMAPGRLTLVAMHHPPIVMGIPAWDEIGLHDADRQALVEVVERHPQVRRLVRATFIARSEASSRAGACWSSRARTSRAAESRHAGARALR